MPENKTYLDTMMRGNTRVRQTIGKFLEEQVPINLAVLRLQNDDIDEINMPDPQEYLANDPNDTKSYPSVGLYCTGTDHFEMSQTLPSGGLEFDGHYEVTIFVATKTANLGRSAANYPLWERDFRHSALRQRDDLTAVVRHCILNTPSFGTADDAHYQVRADRNTLREAYQEPVKLQGASNPIWIASGIINVDVMVSERTVLPIIGRVKDVDLHTYLIDDEETE